MKILYIGHEQVLSGASRSLMEMMTEVSRFHEVYVLSAFRNGMFVDAVKKAGFSLISVPFFRWRLHFKGNTKQQCIKKNIYRLLQVVNYLTLPYLIYKVKQQKIELIHTNTTSTHIGCLLSKFTGIPHVLHVREFGEEDFNMTFLWKEQNCYRMLNQYTDRVIYISQAVKEKYQGKITVAHEVIYNGVGVEYQQNGYVRCGKRRPLSLLIAGRIEETKGQQDAIRAIAHLREQGIKDIRLYIAGSGDTQALARLVEEYGLKNQVVFLGYQKDMPVIRRQMDVELVCSCCEAFGRVTVEAFMSGMPVIGSDAGGTRELIFPGENGLLYPPKDVKALADAIQQLYENLEQVEKMSQNAMEYAEKTFTAEQNGKNILRMYREILAV